MRSRFSRFRLSPAFPISLLALFVALGGIAAAAATIGTKDLKKNAVTSKKIKNHTIKKKDLKFDPTGAQGPAGPAGPQGPAGPSGGAGPAGTGIAVGTTAAIATAEDDPTIANGGVQVLAFNEGFAWALVCTTAPADPTTLLIVHNDSGGNDSHITGGADGENDDFDQGDDYVVTAEGASNDIGPAVDWVYIFGTASGGTTQAGTGNVVNEPNFGGNPDCSGALNFLAQ